MSKTEPQRALIPDRLVGERYGRSTKTIERWGKDPKLGFPPVIRCATAGTATRWHWTRGTPRCESAS
jgi:hypothetical protein